jgi:hypothetical protein
MAGVKFDVDYLLISIRSTRLENPVEKSVRRIFSPINGEILQFGSHRGWPTDRDRVNQTSDLSVACSCGTGGRGRFANWKRGPLPGFGFRKRRSHLTAR